MPDVVRTWPSETSSLGPAPEEDAHMQIEMRPNHNKSRGGCWSIYTKLQGYLERKTLLLHVFERKIPSVALYLALQENKQVEK